MAATRRLTKELADIQSASSKTFREIKADESNILQWQGLLVPEAAPYNKGAFRIEINFPAEYPFKPPKINFRTKIYHPNIDEKGQVCLPIIQADNWKPATKTEQDGRRLRAEVSQNGKELLGSFRVQSTGRFMSELQNVVQSLLDLISEPEPEHPLRADLAEEFTKDRKKFMKNAEDFTKKYSEKRPE